MLKLWNHFTAKELEMTDKEKPVAAIVVGSCEQHARHLPLGTDLILGEAMVKEAARKADSTVFMLPSIPYGFSRHHLAFTGTLSLEQEELAHMIETIFYRVHSYGFRKLLVINSHGGNSAALHIGVNELGAKYGVNLVMAKYWDFAGEYIEKQWRETPLGGLGHAGEMETALMMHIMPELVREKEIIDYKIPQGGNRWFNADMFAKNAVVMYNNFEIYSPDGNVGMGQYGTAEKGKALFEYCTDRLAEFLDEFWADNRYTSDKTI